MGYIFILNEVSQLWLYFLTINNCPCEKILNFITFLYKYILKWQANIEISDEWNINIIVLDKIWTVLDTDINCQLLVLGALGKFDNDIDMNCSLSDSI